MRKEGDGKSESGALNLWSAPAFFKVLCASLGVSAGLSLILSFIAINHKQLLQSASNEYGRLVDSQHVHAPDRELQIDLAWHFCYAAAKTPVLGIKFQIWDGTCPSWPPPAHASSHLLSGLPTSDENDEVYTAQCLLHSSIIGLPMHHELIYPVPGNTSSIAVRRAAEVGELLTCESKDCRVSHFAGHGGSDLLEQVRALYEKRRPPKFLFIERSHLLQKVWAAMICKVYEPYRWIPRSQIYYISIWKQLQSVACGPKALT